MIQCERGPLIQLHLAENLKGAMTKVLNNVELLQILDHLKNFYCTVMKSFKIPTGYTITHHLGQQHWLHLPPDQTGLSVAQSALIAAPH